MTTPIEIRIEGKTPLILFPQAINSITFQPATGAYKDSVTISIRSWKAPWTYEGERAQELYLHLARLLGANQLVL